MNPHEIARARSLAYGLLADLMARGVTDSTRAAAKASAAIAAAIEGASEDEVGAQFERAFGWAAPPFEGAYLDAEGTIGGIATDALWTLFRESGFHPDTRSVDVEHLATSLRLLAFLSGAEADAIEDRHQGAVERTGALSRRILDEHLLRWVPLFACAVRRTHQRFPSALVDQIEDLLLTHRAELPGAPKPFELPAMPALLDEEDTGLREIGRWLSLPALSGLVLTRVDLTRIGRGLEVPRGFGERAQLIINLLRSAARFEVFGRSIEALERELKSQQAELQTRRHAGIRDLVLPWTERAERSREVLRDIVERALQAESVPPADNEP